MNILVVAAHPDDEVLGCGGTIARYASEGIPVSILILGEGATSRALDRSKSDPSLVQALKNRAREAGALLGAKDVSFGSFPDNRFDTVALLDIVKVIEKRIAELKPGMVFTQHGGDLNVDHQRTFQAVLTATRPMEHSPVKVVYSYEVASSTEWAFGEFSPAFKPSTFIDISKTLEKKIAAMQMYESEARAFPHPRSPEALRAQAMRWGSTAGLPAAEAFALIRAIV